VNSDGSKKEPLTAMVAKNGREVRKEDLGFGLNIQRPSIRELVNSGGSKKEPLTAKVAKNDREVRKEGLGFELNIQRRSLRVSRGSLAICGLQRWRIPTFGLE
jgi:hypothetical protein